MHSVIIMAFLIRWGRQDHYNWAADQRLPGEQKPADRPHSAPAFRCQPLGNGVSLQVLLCKKNNDFQILYFFFFF